LSYILFLDGAKYYLRSICWDENIYIRFWKWHDVRIRHRQKDRWTETINAGLDIDKKTNRHRLSLTERLADEKDTLKTDRKTDKQTDTQQYRQKHW